MAVPDGYIRWENPRPRDGDKLFVLPGVIAGSGRSLRGLEIKTTACPPSILVLRAV
jgi:hypothetical protein